MNELDSENIPRVGEALDDFEQALDSLTTEQAKILYEELHQVLPAIARLPYNDETTRADSSAAEFFVSKLMGLIAQKMH